MKNVLGILILTALAAPGLGEPGPQEEVVMRIEMHDVPLAEALRQVARQARLNVILDPRLSESPYKQMTVSVRWEHVTPREALMALLENHGLVLVEPSRPPVR